MLIDVLIPTRGRQEFFANCLRSLGATASDKSRVIVHAGFDEDDPASRDDPAWRHAAAETGLTVTTHVVPRQPTSHHLYNALWRRTRGEICLAYADDQTMVTAGWDNVIREAVAKYPDGLAAGAIHDEAQPGAPTYPILPRQWAETIGYVSSELFPFWFADTWVLEVALLCNRHFMVAAATRSQWADKKGRTHRMRNLGFWAGVFAYTRPRRIEEAKKILAKIGAPLPADTEKFAAELAQRHDNLTNPFTAMIMEIMASGDHDHYAAELRTLVELDMLVKQP